MCEVRYEQIYLVIIYGALVKGELSLFNFTFYTICLLNISFFISCALCLFLDKKGEKLYTSPCLILGRILYTSHLVCTSLCYYWRLCLKGENSYLKGEKRILALLC